MGVPREDETHTFERTFTEDDVLQFADVSWDDQDRHVQPDEDGRLMVHGLLTATLPTKVGGDHEVLAREMTFRFRRPVYTDETITCRTRFESVDERDERVDLSMDVVCENGEGDVVLTAAIDGLVWKDA